MKAQRKKYIRILVSVFLHMILLIPITVIHTGGKGSDAFSDRDTFFFLAFLIIEALLFLLLFVIGVKLLSLKGSLYPNGGNDFNRGKKEMSRHEKAYNKYGVLYLVSSVATAFLLLLAGILLSYLYPHIVFIGSPCIFMVFVIITLLTIPLNLILNRLYLESYKKRTDEQIHQHMFSQREYANTVSIKILSRLHNLRRLTVAAIAMLSIAAAYIAFYSGVLFSPALALPLCLYAIFLFFNLYSRIPFKAPKEIFYDDDSYVSERDYPKLYSLARRAASTVNIIGDVKISLTSEFNSSIGKIGDTYSLQLGAMMVYCLSEDELFNILLHEFAHMAPINYRALREYRHYNWLTVSKPKTFMSELSSLHLSFIDTFYCVQFNIYKYVSAVMKEQFADRAIVSYGDTKVGASALLKLNYYNLYNWEKTAYPPKEPPLFSHEIPKNDVLRSEAYRFLSVMANRREEWNRLTAIEILPRSATHPTTKMRLNLLGISDYNLTVPNSSSKQYIEEQEKALNYADSLIADSIASAYGEIRRIEYIEPLEIAETWKSLGRPVVAEEYADVVNALRKVNMNEDATELCERAINELPKAASAYALFLKGCYYLHKYDPEGIGYIYRAFAINRSYIEDGLENIGHFCCLTGRQDELDAYREMAMALAQKQIEEYAEISVLRKTDMLSREHKLPDEVRANIINYISTIDNGQIDSVYLVRKTISGSFFTSVVVVKFKESDSVKEQRDILHRLYYFLDTCDEWQFSLFNYSDVAKVKVDNIPESLIYSGK